MKCISKEELDVIQKTDPLAGLVWQHWIDTGAAALEPPGTMREGP